MEIIENVSLKEYCGYKIGGPARFFCIVKSEDDIKSALEFAKQHSLKLFVLGGGTNILFSDQGFDGLVIKNEYSFIKRGDDCVLETASGTPLQAVLEFCKENGLAGFEWISGIPGTMGGGVAGNAGTSDENNFSKIVLEIKAIDIKTGEEKNFTNNDCNFSYRESFFKNNNDFFIISLKIKLKDGDKEEIKKTSKEILEKRLESQPYDFPSAGSVFKNPDNNYAGKLIEDLGLKGFKIGDAQISEKHANFIINTGNASSSDVKALIDFIKEKVKEKFNIDLQEEIKIIF